MYRNKVCTLLRFTIVICHPVFAKHGDDFVYAATLMIMVEMYPLQALNKRNTGLRRGSVFSSMDESNLELFGVHLGNMLTKSRFHTAAL